MTDTENLPPLVISDEEQWTEILGDVIAMWIQNSSSFFHEQKRKVKEMALGPFLFGVTEYLPKAWIEVLVRSELIERSRLESLGPLNEEEQITLSLAEQLLERCTQLMMNKGDVKTILNFIHDVEERPLCLDGVIDLSYAIGEIYNTPIFTSMWASIRRIYEKKKRHQAGVCVIYFFKIIHQQILHYGQNGSDKFDFTKNKILRLRMKNLASPDGQEIQAMIYCNSANSAFRKKDYNQALVDYTQAMLRNPFDANVMGNRAQAHLFLRKFREAFWDSKRAIILDPTNSKNYYRCACACIEFGWLDDAKEMNEKCMENSQNKKEEDAIKQQAEAIIKKKEEMKRGKEQQTSDIEVAFTCTDGINFRKLLINGCNQFHRRQYQQSVEMFQLAMESVSDLGVERLGIDEDDVHVIMYVLGTALAETGTSHNLMAAIDKFSSILAVQKKEFPAAYYGIVKAYISLNRYKEATTYVQEGLEVVQSVDKVDKDKIHLWPASDCVIEETKHSELKKLLKNQLKECQYPPKPDAFCRIHEDVENPRQEIYFSDPDYKGFVRLTCREKCCLDYHIFCWKTFKSLFSEKHTDKMMLDTQCPTPGCGSTIKTINIYREGAEGAVQLVSTLKETPRTPRPVIKQSITDPGKLRRKQEQKKQRKQRKAEAIEKKRKEREKEEQEKTRRENSVSSACNGDAQKTGLQGVYKGEATVLLKDEQEVLLEGKQKSSKSKKKKEKSKQVIALDVQFRGDEEKVLVSASSLDNEGDFVVSGSGLLPTPGTGVWPIGNGLLPVPSSVSYSDEMAKNLYDFLSDFFRVNGPQEKDSPLLQEWMSDFPEEATQKIGSYGGLANFIVANKRFAVISGRILCNVEDQAKAIDMANLGSNVRLPGMTSLPASRSQQPASTATESRSGPSDLESVKPTFSWEARARRLSQSSAQKSQPALLPTPPPSNSSAWNSSESVSFHNSDKDDFPSYAALDPLPKSWNQLSSKAQKLDPTPDDGFITVSKKKGKAISEAGVSNGTLLNHQVNPPLPVMKNRGPHFLARAEAAAKLDLGMAGKTPDQSTATSKDRLVPKIQEPSFQGRLVRDDMSDVTTHSSDSASVMDLIEELNASEPSLAGSVNSLDKSENGLSLDKLSGSNITSQSPHGGSRFFQSKSSFPSLFTSSNFDSTSIPGSRRDSDASTRSDDLQRSCSPASQGSSGSGQSQPAPLKPLKSLAGIRRGKMKATRDGHTSSKSGHSKLSSLVKSEPGNYKDDSSYSLDTVDSNILAGDKDTSLEMGGSHKSSRTNGDLESFFLDEISKSKVEKQPSGDDQSYQISSSPHSSKSLEAAIGSVGSIWNPIGTDNALSSPSKFSSKLESTQSLKGNGLTHDKLSQHSLKDIWSMGSKGEEVKKDGSQNLFPAPESRQPFQPPTSSISGISSFYMPSFADSLNSPDVGFSHNLRESEICDEKLSTDISWLSKLNSEEDFESKIAPQPLSSAILSRDSSIWGRVGTTVSKVNDSTSDCMATFRPMSLNSEQRLTSTDEICEPESGSFRQTSTAKSRPESNFIVSPMNLNSSLNPFSKEFVPSHPGPDLDDTSLDSCQAIDPDIVETILTAEEETQTDKVAVASTSVNTTITRSHIDELFGTAADLQRSHQVIRTLKSDLEAEKEQKNKLTISLEEMTQELDDKNMALEKMKQASIHFDKQSQASENEMSEMKKQVAQERKRAIESEKKFVHLMCQIMAQKLKSRQSEAQKHLQQMIQVMESLKIQNKQPPPSIISKSKEWEMLDAQCHIQLQTLSTVYGRYNELLDQGTQLEELPDVTTTVIIPDIPKPPSSDDIKQASQAASSSHDSSAPLQPRATAPPPQSTMLKSSHLSAASAKTESREAAHASDHSNPPGFKKMTPLTLPLKQRFPKTNSVASQLTGKNQAPPPVTAFEQIVTELQSFDPNLSRHDVSQMLDQLRHARGGRLNHMNVREISNELAAMVVGKETHQMSLKAESGLGDVIDISRRDWEDELCAICHDDLLTMETQVLQCGHRFHDQCIKQWFDRQRSCPVCRVHSLLPEEFPSLK